MGEGEGGRKRGYQCKMFIAEGKVEIFFDWLIKLNWLNQN